MLFYTYYLFQFLIFPPVILLQSYQDVDIVCLVCCSANKSICFRVSIMNVVLQLQCNKSICFRALDEILLHPSHSLKRNLLHCVFVSSFNCFCRPLKEFHCHIYPSSNKLIVICPSSILHHKKERRYQHLHSSLSINHPSEQFHLL